MLTGIPSFSYNYNTILVQISQRQRRHVMLDVDRFFSRALLCVRVWYYCDGRTEELSLPFNKSFSSERVREHILQYLRLLAALWKPCLQRCPNVFLKLDILSTNQGKVPFCLLGKDAGQAKHDKMPVFCVTTSEHPLSACQGMMLDRSNMIKCQYLVPTSEYPLSAYQGKMLGRPNIIKS